MADIHHTAAQYNGAINILNKSQLSQTNKDLILQFLQDAKEGHHNPLKPATKPVGDRKRTPYLYGLLKLTDALNKEWKHCTDEDIQKILNALQADEIRNTKTKHPYSEATKYGWKILLKIFTRWLTGKYKLKNLNHTLIYVGEEKDKLPDYLTKEQVDKLVLATSNTMYRALLMTEFDAGTRIEEALSLQVKDVNYLDTPNKNKIMRIDVRVSKTKARNVEIPIAQDYVEQWLQVHPDKNPSSYLFGVNGKQLSYGAVRMYFKKLAKKVLPGVRIYPHIFRHSSATYYASRINRQQMCIRYGWAFSSRMPDVYINRAGVDTSILVQQFETEI